MDIRGFVQDQLGYFDGYDVPNVLFALLVAALLGVLAGGWATRGTSSSARHSAVWAALAALALVVVRGQLAVAVALLALLLVLRPGAPRQVGAPALAVAVVLGALCGAGAPLIAAAAAVVLLPLLRWASARPADVQDER